MKVYTVFDYIGMVLPYVHLVGMVLGFGLGIYLAIAVSKKEVA